MHEAVADAFLPRVCRGAGRARASSSSATPARAGTLARDGRGDRRRLRARVPRARSSASRSSPTLDAAIDHVNRFGTGHTEAILTRDLDAARRFTDEVDAAVVIVNASTRFTDGERFGFGAEIGISTQKLHARGPDGPPRAHHVQVRRLGRRPDPSPDESSGSGLVAERFESVATSSSGCAAPTTSPTPTSPASSTSPTGSRSRCWSRGPAGVGKTELAKAVAAGHRRAG